jgi:hypothetical protein
MNHRFANVVGRSSVALAAGMIFLLAQDMAWAQRRGRRIEFSSPASESVSSTNNQKEANSTKLQENLLKQKLLEEQLRDLDLFYSHDPLGGVTAPYYRPRIPIVPSKKERERLDRRKNWVYVLPEDQTKGPTAEEIFKVPEYGPDGQLKPDQTALERYYEAMQKESAGTNGPAKVSVNDPANGLADDFKLERPDDLPMPKKESDLDRRIAQSESTLRKTYDSGPAGDELRSDRGDSQLPSVLDWQIKPSVERAAELKVRREEFQQLLDSRPSAAAPKEASSLVSLPGLAAPNASLNRPSLSDLSAGWSAPKGWSAPAPSAPGAFGLPSLGPASAPLPSLAPPPPPPPARVINPLPALPQRKF